MAVLVLRKSAQVAADSELATAAAALSSGQSAEFTPGNSLGLIETELAWQSQFFHDTVNGLVQIMGKPAADDEAWVLRTYDIAANTWSSHDPTISKAGHLYGILTMDPATGDLYLYPGALSGDTTLYRYRPGTGWTTATASLYSGALTMPANGLGWHPNLYGSGVGGAVATARINADDEGLGIFRASNSSVQNVSLNLALGAQYGQGVYFAAIDKLVLGRSTHILVSANGGGTPTFTNVGAPPIDTSGDSMEGNPGGFGTMMQHPGDSSKLIILQRGGTRQVWTSTDGDSWSSAGTHPFTAPAYALCSLGAGMGAIWCLGATNSTVYSHLWKP